MPDSVMELVGSTMAALPVAAQQVTQAVAVAGRPLEHTDLARLVGEPAARQGAGAALGSGMVVVSSDRYTCVHDLARSAVRDATLPADRRRLHLAMARMLADRGASTANAVDLAETAWHFEQAGSPPDTFSWALRAADAAQRVGDWSATHQQLERALSSAGHESVRLTEEGRINLLERVSAAADYAGHLSTALDHAESAWLLIDPSTDPERAALVQARRCWLLMVLDQVDRASIAAEQANALLPGDAALIAVAEVHVRVALVMGSTGRAEEART